MTVHNALISLAVGCTLFEHSLHSVLGAPLPSYSFLIDPQKELEKELELELVPFLRRGTGGGTSSYFGEGTGTGTSSFLKGTFNCLDIRIDVFAFMHHWPTLGSRILGQFTTPLMGRWC